MRKYLKLSTYNRNGAGKARIDCNSILEQKGFMPINIGGFSNNTILNTIQELITTIKLLWKIKKDDIVFVQIPVFGRLSILVYKILVTKSPYIIVLIHDLNSIRFGWKNALSAEKYILCKSDLIVAHTENMKEAIIEWGVQSDKIKVLTLFDYLTQKENRIDRGREKHVTFAGNLDKSGFLRYLGQYNDLQFTLYGRESSNIPDVKNVEYAGLFSSDDISCIKGNWGLVWDGDSNETCIGDYGDYLRIIASHKLSLYIAAEMPVIVWNHSALAPFVEKEYLGFSINGLHEITQRIDMLSDNDINRIRLSLKKFSVKLRNGEMLSQILNDL